MRIRCSKNGGRADWFPTTKVAGWTALVTWLYGNLFSR